MSNLDKAFDAINNIDLRSNDITKILNQLIFFSSLFAELTKSEVDILRSSYDAKFKLDIFSLSSIVFHSFFIESNLNRKKELLIMLYTLYCFDNLDFGYDSVLRLISTADLIKNDVELAKELWLPFENITCELARENLKNKFFVDS